MFSFIIVNITSYVSPDKSPFPRTKTASELCCRDTHAQFWVCPHCVGPNISIGLGYNERWMPIARCRQQVSLLSEALPPKSEDSFSSKAPAILSIAAGKLCSVFSSTLATFINLDEVWISIHHICFKNEATWHFDVRKTSSWNISCSQFCALPASGFPFLFLSPTAPLWNNFTEAIS